MSLTGTDTGRPSSSRPATAFSRPRTAPSRSNTGRPQTAASSKHDFSNIVAVIEGRGIGREVGIAALDKDTGRVSLVQVRHTCCIYALHRQCIDVESARGLPDLRQDAAPDASPLPFNRPCPRHVHVLVRCFAILRYEDPADDHASCSMYHGRVRRCTHRAGHAQVLER